MSFYDNFIALCEARGVKPTPVLKGLQISPSNLSRWRDGASVTSDILIKISDYFRCPVDTFLYDDVTTISRAYINISLEDGEYILNDYLYGKLSDIKMYLIEKLKSNLSHDELELTLNNINRLSSVIALVEEYKNNKSNDVSAIYDLQKIFNSFSELEFLKEDTHETTS